MNYDDGLPLRPHRNNPDRFWARVDRRGPDECWVWTGSKTKTGYGELMYRGKHVRAHRVAYTLAVGPIEEGLFVCHTCDNRPCCNPRHLFLGTMADNMQDMARKGRAGLQVHPELKPIGVRAPAAKLTDEAVREIKALLATGLTQEDVGRRYGVSQTAIGHIVQGRTWRHVA